MECVQGYSRKASMRADDVIGQILKTYDRIKGWIYVLIVGCATGWRFPHSFHYIPALFIALFCLEMLLFIFS